MSVRIFTTTNCPHCVNAKNFFKSKGISFIEHNVERDIAAAREMVEISGGAMTVPILDVNGKVIVGFNKPAIEKALR